MRTFLHRGWHRTLRGLQDLYSNLGSVLIRNGQHATRLAPQPALGQTAFGSSYGPLQRVVLTDTVSRTLFDEYAAHLQSARGGEETGWVLLGLRDQNQATVMATLPAGTFRDAGMAHVQFDSWSQVIGSRIVRQIDKRLAILGVVHTHPGSLRHPSSGDYEGDREWVQDLRGREGVFGIGTADCETNNPTLVVESSRPHMQCFGKTRFCWYALGHQDRAYRPLAVELTLGPDFARPFRPVWPAIEQHAERLNRLCSQQAKVRLDSVVHDGRPSLVVEIALAGASDRIRVLLYQGEARYYWMHGDQPFAVDLEESRVDRGVYMLLAELAGRA